MCERLFSISTSLIAMEHYKMNEAFRIPDKHVVKYIHIMQQQQQQTPPFLSLFGISKYKSSYFPFAMAKKVVKHANNFCLKKAVCMYVFVR